MPIIWQHCKMLSNATFKWNLSTSSTSFEANIGKSKIHQYKSQDGDDVHSKYCTLSGNKALGQGELLWGNDALKRKRKVESASVICPLLLSFNVIWATKPRPPVLQSRTLTTKPAASGLEHQTLTSHTLAISIPRQTKVAYFHFPRRASRVDHRLLLLWRSWFQ